MTKKHSPNSKELILALTKSAAGAIPLAGATLSEIAAYALAPTLLERYESFLEVLNEGLSGVDPLSNLTDLSKNNQDFVTALARIAPLVQKTADVHKLEMYKNGLINISKSKTFHEYVYVSLISFIDQMTPWHISVLRKLNETDDVEALGIQLDNEPQGHGMKLKEISFVIAIKQLTPDAPEGMAYAISNDLQRLGLVETGPSLYGGGNACNGISTFGKTFLTFIKGN